MAQVVLTRKEAIDFLTQETIGQLLDSTGYLDFPPPFFLLNKSFSISCK
jgi:hypothetical protein